MKETFGLKKFFIGGGGPARVDSFGLISTIRTWNAHSVWAKNSALECAQETLNDADGVGTRTLQKYSSPCLLR